MFSGALGTAVMHPPVADIDAETLLTRVTDLSRRRHGLPRDAHD